jgi:hypothetical protein
MLESSIESALVRGVKRAGGEVRKYVTPGRRHAPDRLVIFPRRGMVDSAWIIFVELKAPGKKPRAGQVREHARLRDMGCNVEVIDTLEGVARFLGENC